MTKRMATLGWRTPWEEQEGDLPELPGLAELDTAGKEQAVSETTEPKVRRTIRFEDHGQDFLEWDLDDQDCVITARPFQHSIWAGHQVSNVEVGECPVISGKELERPLTMNYAIVSIETPASDQ